MLLAVLLPMLPLIATVTPIESVIKRIFSAALGGLPV